MLLQHVRKAWPLLLASLIGTGFATPAFSESPRAKQLSAAPAPIVPPYADLADLAEASTVVLRAKVKQVAELEQARAGKVRPGFARLYIEAVTESLLTGPEAVGSTLRYLADVRRDAKGKAPKLAKQSVLLFANHVNGRPGELQLVAPDAQIAWNAPTEAKVVGILRELFAKDAPRRIKGVHEASFVPGNLAGEGETQVFLETADGEPAALSVLHHPGLPMHWGISFSEVVETEGRPPAKDTLTWYRLACFLPAALPAGVNVSATPEDKQQAEADYKAVIADLGPCGRARN